MTIGVDIIGYIGGSIIASSMPLQVYQSYKRGSTCDISWKWLSGYVIGISLLFIYAHLQNIPPVWGPLCLEITSTFILIILKIKYDIIEHKVYSFEISTQTENDNDNEKIINEKIIIPRINHNNINNNNNNNNSNNHKYKMIEVETGGNDMV